MKTVGRGNKRPGIVDAALTVPTYTQNKVLKEGWRLIRSRTAVLVTLVSTMSLNRAGLALPKNQANTEAVTIVGSIAGEICRKS